MDHTTAPHDDAAPPSPPSPPPAAPLRRMTRHPSDKVVAGVAGGLGRYFGVDPILFRIAFVAFTLVGGGGLLLYLLAWIAMPVGEGDAARPAAPPRDIAPWLGLGLVVVALLVLGGALFAWRPPVVMALVLLAAGVLLFQHSGQRQPDAPVPSPPTPGGAPSPAVGGARDTAELAGSVAPKPAMAPPFTPPPSPDRGLGQLFLALLVLALSALWLLEGLLADGPGVHDYLAAVLGVIGLALVIGAWRGRARWLIPVGALLTPVLLLASIMPPVPFGGDWGEHYVRPQRVSDLAPEYRLGAGSLLLDLSAIRPARGREVEVHAMVGMGEIRVLVPGEVQVDAYGEAGVGQVRVFGRHAEGLRPDAGMLQPGHPLWGTLVIRVSAGMGSVSVEHSGVRLPIDFRPFAPEVRF